jgi:hypothetical protein
VFRTLLFIFELLMKRLLLLGVALSGALFSQQTRYLEKEFKKFYSS